MSTEEARMESTAAGGTGEPQMNSGSSTGTKTPEVNLFDELRAFGKHLEAIVNTARTSPRAQEFEHQFTSTWRDVERGINKTINKAQTTDLKDTITGTAQYAADEVQGGLARGLHTVNQWMSQKIREAEERQRKMEQSITNKATDPTTDNEIEDRFSGNDPVFGEGLQVPAAPVQVTPDPNAAENPESLITERFEDEPPETPPQTTLSQKNTTDM